MKTDTSKFATPQQYRDFFVGFFNHLIKDLPKRTRMQLVGFAVNNMKLSYKEAQGMNTNYLRMEIAKFIKECVIEITSMPDSEIMQYLQQGSLN